jgi:cytochrome c-type biogenesis protein CcmE
MTEENIPIPGDDRPEPNRGPSRAQRKIVVGAAILVAAIGFLIYSAIDTSASYYVTVCEARSMGQAAADRSLRLEGVVAPGSVTNDGANLQYTFEIMEDPEKNPDCSQRVPVYHKGVLPDLMQPDALPPEMASRLSVIVEGRFNDQGAFVADRVLTSCPSRYDAAKDVKDQA